MKGYVNLTHTNNAKFNILQEQMNKKQNSEPIDNIPLINSETNKIDNAYIPRSIGDARKFAGTFGENGIIVASVYASEVNGQYIGDIDKNQCVGYEFTYLGETSFYLIVNENKVLELNKGDILVCNGNLGDQSWTIIDNSDRVISVNGQTGAVEVAGLEDVHTVLILGANGTIGTNANFVVEDAESYIPYRNNLTEFIFSGIIPVTGEIDLTKEVTIDFGDTSYYLFSAVDTSKKLTLGDLDFALKESLVTGYNYLFRTIFFKNADAVGFAVMPDKEDVLSLDSDQMDNYIADGGLPQGQLAICKKVITNGYTEGGIYRFKITYPSTYEWEEITAGSGTVGDTSKLLKIPEELPATQQIVSINTDGTQQNLTLGNGLTIADGVIKTGEVYYNIVNLRINGMGWITSTATEPLGEFVAVSPSYDDVKFTFISNIPITINNLHSYMKDNNMNEIPVNVGIIYDSKVTPRGVIGTFKNSELCISPYSNGNFNVKLCTTGIGEDGVTKVKEENEFRVTHHGYASVVTSVKIL